jgi:NADH-quinone oxidoreductase subunit J
MAILMTIAVAIGGVGLYLAMPRGRARAGAAPLVVLAAAAAVLIGLLIAKVAGHSTAGWFVPLSIIGIAAGLRVVTHPKPVYSALYFILVIVAVAGLLLLMDAEFLAMALVMIYAGAILVTYVFVIMLAQQTGESSYDRQAREPFLAILAGFVVLGTIGSKLFQSTAGELAADPIGMAAGVDDNVVQVGTSLLTTYAVGVELAGVLLLAALVGAIAIARRKALDEPEGDIV